MIHPAPPVDNRLSGVAFHQVDQLRHQGQCLEGGANPGVSALVVLPEPYMDAVARAPGAVKADAFARRPVDPVRVQLGESYFSR